MNFLKSKSKLIFSIVSIIVSFSLTTAEANIYNNYSNQNNQPNIQNKVYVGYGYIDKQDPYDSSLYYKYGAEIALGTNNKLKIERGSGDIYLTKKYDTDNSYVAVGFEHYGQGYIAEVDVKSFNKLNTIQAKLGNKYDIAENVYITPKVGVKLMRSRKSHYSYEKIKTTTGITPEITVGTNLDIPNTIISLNPEFYLGYHLDPTSSSKNYSNVGMSIGMDINMIFMKLGYQANNLEKHSSFAGDTSLTFGVKF